MSDEELSSLLSEIQEGAKELNSASDEINSIITSIEQKIVASNVGIECWLDDPLYTSKFRDVSLGAQGDPGSTWTDTILGFAKTKEGWKLCVKERLYVAEHTEWGDRSEPEINPNFMDPSPLWRASRQLRIDAMKKMPALLQVIRDAIKESLDAIATAKKLVE